MFKNKLFYFLFLILCLGFTLRVMGIGYGLPYLSHPDETRIVLDTLSMGHRHSLLPVRIDYPLLFRYLLLFIYGIYYLLGRLFHFFSGPYDFALKFLIDPTGIYLVSRMANVIIGTVMAIPAYILGKNIFKDKRIGVVSFIFVLFEFQLVQHSQWALFPISLCFVILFTFYFMFKQILDPSRNNFILSGLFCGLALSVQNQAIFLIPSLGISYLLAFTRNRKLLEPGKFFRRLSISLLCLIFFALIGNFYWFFIFKKALAELIEVWGVSRVVFSSSAPYNYNIFSMFLWFIAEVIRQDMLLGIVMVSGLFYALLRRKPADIVFLVFVISYLYFMSGCAIRVLHDLLSLLPIVCVFGAVFLVGAADRLYKGRYIYVLSVLVVLPLILQEFSVDLKKMRKDTRVEAREWIQENVPCGARIGVDWSLFSVPLESRVPFFLRNPVAKEYYEQNIEPLLGNKYREYLKAEKVYDIDELMLWADEPIWPKEMPQAVIEKARRKPVYRDLYSRFIFKDMDTIINRDRDEYIIITSYAWSMFLLNDDPYKKNLFTPFIKDRSVANYSHSPQYLDDNRHGFMFYLIKQGRDFYTPLLYNKLKNVKLMREFAPGNNLGPTIRIYKIIKR